MDKDFSLEKKNFIETYNLARSIMTILGDQVRQEILLALIESGGWEELLLYWFWWYDSKASDTILATSRAMLKRCSKEGEKRL